MHWIWTNTDFIVPTRLCCPSVYPYISVFFCFSVIVLAFKAIYGTANQDSKGSRMDEQTGCFLIESVSMNVREKRVIGRGNYSRADTLGAAFPAHFTTHSLNLCLRLQRSLSAACLTLTELCSDVLVYGSSCCPDWCLDSKACSHTSAVRLPHPPFCTSSSI